MKSQFKVIPLVITIAASLGLSDPTKAEIVAAEIKPVTAFSESNLKVIVPKDITLGRLRWYSNGYDQNGMRAEGFTVAGKPTHQELKSDEVACTLFLNRAVMTSNVPVKKANSSEFVAVPKNRLRRDTTTVGFVQAANGKTHTEVQIAVDDSVVKNISCTKANDSGQMPTTEEINGALGGILLIQ